MSNYIKEIEAIQSKVQNNKEELIRLEEQEKNLKSDKEKILVELQDLEINEEDIQDKIDSLEAELKSDIEKIEEQLK